MPTVYGMTYRKGTIEDRYKKQYLMLPLLSDMTVLYCLREVAPVTDANMFMIYGAENGYSIEDLSVSDMTELASKLQPQLAAYVDNKIKLKIKEIIARWWKFISDNDIVFSIPEPNYKQFSTVVKNLELVRYRFNNINSEAIISVLEAAQHDFMAMGGDKFGDMREDIPVDPELCGKFFKNLFDWGSLNIANRGIDPSQRFVINKQMTFIAASFLKMVTRGVQNCAEFSHFDSPREVYRVFFHNMFTKEPKSVREYIRKCRALQPCHVLALNTAWNDNLIIPTDPIHRDNLSSEFAHILLHSNKSDNELKKAVKVLGECLRAEGECEPTCIM